MADIVRETCAGGLSVYWIGLLISVVGIKVVIVLLEITAERRRIEDIKFQSKDFLPWAA